MRDVVDLAEKLSLVSEHWAPKTVAALDDYDVGDAGGALTASAERS